MMELIILGLNLVERLLMVSLACIIFIFIAEQNEDRKVRLYNVLSC